LPGFGSGVSLVAIAPNRRAMPIGGVVVVTKNSRWPRAGKLPIVQMTLARNEGIPGALGPAVHPDPIWTIPTPTGSMSSTRAPIASPNSEATTTLAVRLPFASNTVSLRICRSACQMGCCATAECDAKPRVSMTGRLRRIKARFLARDVGHEARRATPLAEGWRTP
jgi:hypothetical protein